MLTPDYFVPERWERLLRIYTRFEGRTFDETAKALAKKKRDEERFQRLLLFGLALDEIERLFAETMAEVRPEVGRVLELAVRESTKQEAPLLDRIGVERLPNERANLVFKTEWAKTNADFEVITRKALERANEAVVRLRSEAEFEAASGLASYDEAVGRALDRYASQGLTTEFPANVVSGIEPAVRGAIITGMNRTASEITNATIAYGGITHVLTSAHAGARIGKPGQPPCGNHMGWQGKVFDVETELEEATGYRIKDGRGEVVDMHGLHGWNCRHSHMPFDPKTMKNPFQNEKGEVVDANGEVITAERNERVFKLNQKARRLERGIRETERLLRMEKSKAKNGIAPDGAKGRASQLRTKLKGQVERYSDFRKENGLDERTSSPSTY